MRGKSLFKKFVAIIAAVAMIATMSVSVFAAFGDDAVGYYAKGIKITEASYAAVVGNDGAYTITVKYALDEGVENKIGITMLAYAGDDLEVTASGYTEYDSETMTIVGVGQQKQDASLAGEFNFTVSTDGDVTEGEPFIVKVSGDSADVSPAAAAITIGASVPTATEIILDEEDFAFEITEGDDYAAFVKQSLIDYGLEGILYNAEGDVLDNIDIDDEWIGTPVNSTGKLYGLTYYNYTTTVTIPAGVLSNEGKAKTCATTLTVYADVYRQATSVQIPDMTFMLDDIDSLETLKSAIESKFADDGAVKLSFDDENYADAKAGSASEITTEDSFNPEATEDQTLEFAADLSDYYINASPVSIKMGEDGFTGQMFTVKVVFEATDAEAASASITYSGDAIDVETQGDASEEIKTWLEANMEDQTANLYDSEGIKIGTVAVTKDDITGVELKEDNTYTVSVTIPDDADVTSEEGFNATLPEGGLDASFEVTGNYKPARILGDVNNDQAVDDLDWMAVFNHVSYIIEFDGLPSWNDPEVFDKGDFYAADVNGDNAVDDLDWMAIFNHVSYIIEDPNLPAW